MTEYDNVRDALKDAIETTEVARITISDSENTRDATVEDIQEIFRERLYNIADLLGMEELYLGEKNK